MFSRTLAHGVPDILLKFRTGSAPIRIDQYKINGTVLQLQLKLRDLALRIYL